MYVGGFLHSGSSYILWGIFGGPSQDVRNEMAFVLSLSQMGNGIRVGVELAVHAARCFITKMPSDHVVVHLDFVNAVNFLCKDKMLEAVHDLAPNISLVHSSYSSPTHIQWGDKLIFSAEGMQQRFLFGPLLCCLTLHQHCHCLSFELFISYPDDVTIGGSRRNVVQDFMVMKEARDISLILNLSKSGIIS